MFSETDRSPAERSSSPAEDAAPTYGPSRLQRWTGVAGLLCIPALIGLEVTGESSGSLLQLLTTCVLFAALSISNLRTTVRLSADWIRKDRPLWPDVEVRFANVQRLYVPVTGVVGLEFYTDSADSEALSIRESGVEGYNDLLLQVAERLPEHADIEDPSGRLAQLRNAEAG